MAKPKTVAFTGESGTSYTFKVYPLATNFKAVGGVYFYTVRKEVNNKFSHFRKVYVGQTGDLSERFEDHHKANCIKKQGATCICILVEEDEDRRFEIEADLIAAYSPTCNG